MEKPIFGENDKNRLRGIVAPLLRWYGENRRALPWRENTEPYRIWVSEVMLQQTQVETVIPYYERFIQTVPDVRSLAELPEERLYKLWEGLGYYGRARNLQRAARAVLERFAGKFPETYGELLSLPGVGSYTAGAVASICFNRPVAAVDGNVLRVAARLTGYGGDVSASGVKEALSGLLGGIYPADRCGDFTQALMELGATVCLPNGAPKCGLCPVSSLCRAFETGEQGSLPVKTRKKPRKKALKTVFLLRCRDKIAVRRREGTGLLGGLWEFPNAEGHLTPAEAEELLASWGAPAASMAEGVRKKHVFTHVEWDMISYSAVLNGMPPDFQWVTRERLAGDMALPSAFQGFFGAL